MVPSVFQMTEHELKQNAQGVLQSPELLGSKGWRPKSMQVCLQLSMSPPRHQLEPEGGEIKARNSA